MAEAAKKNKKIKTLSFLLYGTLAFLWVVFIFAGYKIGVKKSSLISEPKAEEISPAPMRKAFEAGIVTQAPASSKVVVRQQEIQFEKLSLQLASNRDIDYKISAVVPPEIGLQPLSVLTVKTPSAPPAPLDEKRFEITPSDFTVPSFDEPERQLSAAAEKELKELKEIKKPDIKFTEGRQEFLKKFDLNYEFRQEEPLRKFEFSPYDADYERNDIPAVKQSPKPLPESEIKLFQEVY